MSIIKRSPGLRPQGKNHKNLMMGLVIMVRLKSMGLRPQGKNHKNLMMDLLRTCCSFLRLGVVSIIKRSPGLRPQGKNHKGLMMGLLIMVRLKSVGIFNQFFMIG